MPPIRTQNNAPAAARLRANTLHNHANDNQTGLSLLEFTLIVIVVGVLMVMLMQRLVDLRVDIERAAVERTESALRTGLALEFADLAVTNRLDEARDWAGANALQLLDTQPILDAELEGAGPEALGPGEWSYDTATGEIVYRVQYSDAFIEAAPEGRWRVVVIGGGSPRGLDLETTQPIHWP